MLVTPIMRGIALAAAVAVLTTVGAYAQTEPKLTPIRIQHYQGLLINQSTYVAYYTGIFKKHGLDATLVPVASGPATEAAVHAGSVEIGTQDIDQTMINTHRDNLNFVNLCGAEGPYYQVVASPQFKDQIKGPLTYPAVMKNFVGKRLGVTALGADTNYFWEALFQGAGLAPDSGTYVGTGVGQTSLSAVEHGLVDATMGFEPLTTIEAQNGGKIIVNVAKGQGPALTRALSPQLIYFASKTWVDAHPDVAAAFNASILEAAKFQQDPKNFPKVLDAMKQALGPLSTSPDFERVVRENIALSSVTGLTLQSSKAWLEFSQAFLNFPKDVTLEAIHKEITWANACK